MRLLLSVVSLLAPTTCFGQTSDAPRLTAGSHATVLLDGKPFRGIGVNYFDCFLRTLHDEDDTSYDSGFATLGRMGIPFVRFAATGFWPRDMKLYIENRDEYFRRLDAVVRSAEIHGVGLVPSLFWYYACVPDLVGEPMDQWASPQSETQAWMRRYVEEVVTRYKKSPAIWMWEMGNEYSLVANLPNAEQHRPQIAIKLGTPAARSARDQLTFAMVRQAFTAFALEVQKYDPHRLVSTGDSMLRPSAWHQEREGTWTRDTADQYAEMLGLANPDPVSTISLHAYDDAHDRFPSFWKASLRMNKPVFLGEFGVQGETPESAEKFRGMLAAITENKIPLAALWVFDYARQPKFNITATNARDWQLEAIADTNALLHQPRSTSRD
jgi:hypothetical protein